MELTRKQKSKKYFLYFLIILILDLLQNVAGLFPQVGGARCFLLLPAIIILAMGEDIVWASALGLFAGLLWDLTGSVHLGFNCIVLTAACFLTAVFSAYIARDTFITNIITSAITISLYCVMYWLFFIIIKGVNGGANTIFTFYIPCAIYTIVLTPVLWLILTPIKKKLNHTEKQEFK